MLVQKRPWHDLIGQKSQMTKFQTFHRKIQFHSKSDPFLKHEPFLWHLSKTMHGSQFTGGVHSPNQFVPDIVSPLPCSPVLVRHTLLIVYFFTEFISFIGFRDKCHTSVFNALIFYRIAYLLRNENNAGY